MSVILLQDGKTPLSLGCVACSSIFSFQLMMAVLLLAYDSFSARSASSAATCVVSHGVRALLPGSRFAVLLPGCPPLQLLCTRLLLDLETHLSLQSELSKTSPPTRPPHHLRWNIKKKESEDILHFHCQNWGYAWAKPVFFFRGCFPPSLTQG